MADSLRDLLLKSGIVKQVQENRVREPKRPVSPKGREDRNRRKPVPQGQKAPAGQEMDLAKAYAIRTQTEARERRQAEKDVAEQARLRREMKARLQKLLEGKALNKPEAELARNFEYGGKIRRVHVDADQLASINAGKLGVVQQAGRYLLVTRELAEQVKGIDPRQLALLVDPGDSAAADDGVPDDLIW